MAKILPFKGLLYNIEKVSIDKVVTQPYDKITKEMQEEYYKRSEYNIVRLILNKDADPYTSAKIYFDRWLKEKIFIQDNKNSIYPYYQEFEINGEKKVRKGFIALMEVEDYSTGTILPHERTLLGPKQDRLNLLRATKTNFELIFLLYPDEKQEIAKIIDENIEKTIIEVEESYEKKVIHKLWKIDKEEVINEVKRLMRDRVLLIADGHHRYETALNYSKENPNAKYVMATFVSLHDPNLVILPTHRALYGINIEGYIDKLKNYFYVNECECKEKMENELNGKHFTYGIYDGKYWLISLKEGIDIHHFMEVGRSDEYKKLDITVLHSVVFEGLFGISKESIARKECIDYLREIGEGIKGVDTGKYKLFFVLNPTKIEEVQMIAKIRETMPQKSTDFYPKLISGLVIYKIEND